MGDRDRGDMEFGECSGEFIRGGEGIESGLEYYIGDVACVNLLIIINLNSCSCCDFINIAKFK